MTDGLQGFELTDRKAIESRYQRIVDNARTGVLQTTPDGRILTANPAVAQILGFASVEEMMRTAPSMADRYADAGRRDRLLRELKQHGSVAESEVQLRRGDGSLVWVAIDIQAIHDESGATYHEGTIVDITERKRAQAAAVTAMERIFRRRRIWVLSEFAVVVILGAGFYGLASRFHWFEALTGWVLGLHDVGRLDVDELFLTLIFLGAGFLVLSFRRWRASEWEVTSYRQMDAASRLVQGELDLRVKQRTEALRAANEALRREAVERVRAEAVLRLQSAALTAAANGIVITDREGVIVWVNPAFATLTGYSLVEAVGKNPRDLVKSGQHPVAFYQDLWRTIVAGHVWSGEMVNRRKDGSLYPEQQTITPVRDAGGKITHFIAIKLDLTEARRAEEVLRMSEERYRLLFENNPLPMWLYDRETLRFLATNDSVVQHYGYTREELAGMRTTQFHPEEDVPVLLKAIGEAGGGPLLLREWRHRRKDGTVIHVEVIARSLEYNGRPARLVIATDITEKKLLEEKFLHAQRLESIGLLAAGIAHDLNNVLAPIMFVAPLLRHSLSNPQDLKVLATLEQSAARGAGLVKQILGFAHSGTSELHLTQVKHLARDIVSVVEQTFPKSIQLEHTIPTDLWPVLGNATQIHQMLLNLCVNARDSMPHGGTLRLTAQNRRLDAVEAGAIAGARPGPWIVIEIADTGTGIPPEILARIWEPFFTTKAVGKGTGLGLSTVRGLVAGHQGFIELRTAVGQGTTFRLFLPAADNETGPAGSTAPFVISDGAGELILVVDDDTSVREIVAKVLVNHGYRIVSCKDGVEAIALFATQPEKVSLVITDINMPYVGGAVLVRALRQMKPDIRLIAMSGLDRSESDDAEVQEVEKLVHVFLRKPFKADDLLQTVHGLLHPAGKP